MSNGTTAPNPAATPIGRLLVIDDDQETRAITHEALAAAGFQTEWVGDGITGLESAAKTPPDLVVIDLHDATLDGFEVVRRLRKTRGLGSMPIVFLTALGAADAVDRALAAGANDFIRKPANATLLVHRLREALRMKDLRENGQRQQLQLDQAQRMAGIGTWYWRSDPDLFECSTQYRRLVGLAPGQELGSFEQLLARVHPQDSNRVAAAMSAAWQSGSPYSMSYRLVRDDGSSIVVEEKVEAVTDRQGRVARIEGTTQDISERIADRERIRELSQRDLLTGLTNRSQFSQAVRPMLSNAILRGHLAAVIDINIDRFTRINETLGHAAGDLVLQEVASRIRRSVRLTERRVNGQQSARSDLYARMSGDEFAVLVTGLQRPIDAQSIARRILNEIARPIEVAGQSLSVTACAGIALSNRVGIDASTLLCDAESAMRQAKHAKAGSLAVFAAGSHEPQRTSLSMENELRTALAEGQFLVHYQPRVDVRSGVIVGAEALIRWLHPERGLVMPGAFISVAEDSGQIDAITAWILEDVCRQQAQWRSAGLDIVPVSVNFSSQSFQGEGPSGLIRDTLARHGLSASALEVEITESVMMQDIDTAARTLAELREMGLELSIDDFGTGFSSLNYLKRLPVSVLKIDRDFVKDVLVDAHDGAIAAAIVALSQAIGLRVVAEGVETLEQAQFLLALGCRLMQGYLFSRPVAAAEFERMIGQGLALPAPLATGAPLERDAPRSTAVPLATDSWSGPTAQPGGGTRPADGRETPARVNGLRDNGAAGEPLPVSEATG